MSQQPKIMSTKVTTVDLRTRDRVRTIFRAKGWRETQKLLGVGDTTLLTLKDGGRTTTPTLERVIARLDELEAAAEIAPKDVGT